MKKDIFQRLAELLEARSKTLTEMLQLSDELNKKLDENNDNGSADGLGSASMNMKVLELKFTAAIQYFQDIEDPDKEATEILGQLASVVDMIEAANILDAVPLIRKAVDQAAAYKFKHTGEEFELDHKKMMGLIKEFVTDSDTGQDQRTVKEALAELEKTAPKKSTDLKL